MFDTHLICGWENNLKHNVQFIGGILFDEVTYFKEKVHFILTIHMAITMSMEINSSMEISSVTFPNLYFLCDLET